jgi:hypothetical protein
MFRLRALAVLALVFALSGCMKVDAQVAIHDDDTVSGSIVMALDKRLAALTGKTQDQLVQSITLQPGAISKDAVAEPYEDSDYIGRRFVFTGVPLKDFHGTDQVTVTLVHDDRSYLFNGVADLRTVNLADPAVQRFASLFSFTVSVTFPGRVVESNGVLNGRTVTWTPKAGESLAMHARAEKTGLVLWPWIVGAGVFLVVIATAIGVVAFSRRHPASEAASEDDTEQLFVETRHDML